MEKKDSKKESVVVSDGAFCHPLPEGSSCVSPEIDVLDYCRVEHVSDGSVYIRNDASLLFHLRDVEKKYGATVANSLASRSASASLLQTDMDNLTDDELFRTIVPKSVQSPSEVQMFTESLGMQVDTELSKLDSASVSAPSSDSVSSSAAGSSSVQSSSNSD